VLMLPRADLTPLRGQVSSRPWLASATDTNGRTPHCHPADLANTVLTTARRGALARQHGGNMMCHLAMLEGTGDGDGTTWLEPVTDEQYQAANQP